MMSDSVYVHIDTTSNAVLTKGLTINDFSNSIVHFPQNLLLLDPSASAGRRSQSARHTVHARA